MVNNQRSEHWLDFYDDNGIVTKTYKLRKYNILPDSVTYHDEYGNPVKLKSSGPTFVITVRRNLRMIISCEYLVPEGCDFVISPEQLRSLKLG